MYALKGVLGGKVPFKNDKIARQKGTQRLAKKFVV
jgi:hypothetical protein